MDPTTTLSPSQPSSFVSASVPSLSLHTPPFPPDTVFTSVPIPSQQLPTSATLTPSYSMDSRWPDLDFFELGPSPPLSSPSATATSWVLPTHTSPIPPQAPPTIPSDDLAAISLVPSTQPSVNTAWTSTPQLPLSSSPPEESTSASTQPNSALFNLPALDLCVGTSALPSIIPPPHHNESSPRSALHLSLTPPHFAQLTKSHPIYHDQYPTPRPRIHKQTRRYTAPKSSRYCHLCARHQRSVTMVPCGNVQLGLCQKSVCTKCIATYGLDVRVSNWACPHCCNSCPKRAKCFSYDRQTARRREKTLIAKLNSVIRSNSSKVHPSHCVISSSARILHPASST